MKNSALLAIGGGILVLLLSLTLCLPMFAIIKAFCGTFDMLSWFTSLHCPSNSSSIGATGPDQPGAWDIVNNAMAGEYYLCPDDPKKCTMANNLDYYDPKDSRTVHLPFEGGKSAYFDALKSVHLDGDPKHKVQCVGFVESIYQISKHPLPTGAYYAEEYWDAFKDVPGWSEIPNGVSPADAPVPGDMIVWEKTTGDHTPGHIAIVVATDIKLTHNTTDGKNGNDASKLSGSIYVAQANQPGNYITKNNDPLFPFPVPAGIHLLKLDYGADKLESTKNDDKSILGFIDNPSLSISSLGGLAGNISGLKIPPGLKSKYVAIAAADAQKYGYNPILYVRQINQESGFNPIIVSPAGAAGIAQFMPGTARSWGLTVDGQTDERNDPVKALDASSRMMASAYKHYLGSDKSPGHQLLAYEEAIAAYNCGGGCVSERVRIYGNQWAQHLPAETQNYIKVIMGSNPSIASQT